MRPAVQQIIASAPRAPCGSRPYHFSKKNQDHKKPGKTTAVVHEPMWAMKEAKEPKQEEAGLARVRSGAKDGFG
jgi:hypothetical protein